jgi:hypothetical protein
LADLVAKVARSMETAISIEAYNAFVTAMSTLSTGAAGTKVVGYTQTDFAQLSQKIAAFNGGSRPIVLGTQVALANILPADANYRYDLESDYVKFGYIKNFLGSDIVVLPQIADWQNPFQLLVSDSFLWFLSPSGGKFLKVVLEGSTLSYVSDTYAFANLLQTSTIYKSWGVGIATAAIAGVMTV